MKRLHCYDIAKILAGCEVPLEPWQPLDEFYVVPDAMEMVRLIEHCRRQVVRNGFGDYKSNSRDCDNIALFTASMAKMLNDDPRGELAIAAVGYTHAPRAKHMINFSIVEHEGRIGMLFSEPQDGSIVSLTPEQISSIDYIVL